MRPVIDPPRMANPPQPQDSYQGAPVTGANLTAAF